MIITDGFIEEIIVHVGLGSLAVDARVPLQLECACARAHCLRGALAHLTRAHTLQGAEPNGGFSGLSVQHLTEKKKKRLGDGQGTGGERRDGQGISERDGNNDPTDRSGAAVKGQGGTAAPTE